MNMRLFLIEDDPATRRMLERILEDGDIGRVIGTASSGDEVTAEDVRDADIVLIDLLMPGKDGIETVNDLRAQGYAGRFVMISQVENKEMVGAAYLSGVEYFIHKPVNRLEVLAVLRRVSEMLSLEASLSSIRRSLSVFDERQGARLQAAPAVQPAAKSFDATMLELQSRLGIAGESGSHDLNRLLKYVHGREKQGDMSWRELTLKDLYHAFLLAEAPKLSAEQVQREIKAMEQRLRRTILQALGHLASIGLTDFSNPLFEHFAPRLFDFQEVRVRMQEIRDGDKTTKCRLNIKKFLTALFAEAKAEHEA